MSDGDNRIRLDETPVDFSRTDDVDQLHTNYPEPKTHARYDYTRSFLIGLLSNQSSEEEPFEKRVGTTWFDKSNSLLKLFNGELFDAISKYISVETLGEEGETTTSSLQSILNDIVGQLAFVSPTVVWSGVFTEDEVNSIPIPKEYIDYASIEDMISFVWIDGLLIDPRSCIINKSHTEIDLIGINPNPQQRFTVKLEKVTSLKKETVPATA